MQQAKAIDFANFVEGYLSAVSVNDEEGSVDLLLRDTKRNHYTLTASGVDRFLVLDMREKNIIDHITIWDESESAECRQNIYTLVSGGADSESKSKYDSIIDGVVASIKARKEILLEIEPVYGAQVLALARNVSIAKRDR